MFTTPKNDGFRGVIHTRNKEKIITRKTVHELDIRRYTSFFAIRSYNDIAK